MPLKPGKKNMGSNIAELERAGHSKSQSAAIAYKEAGEDKDQPYDLTLDTEKESAREHDVNGWAEIKGNPISRTGIFPYSGGQISPELEADKIYNIYRSEEELNNQDTINSFKLLPWTDEHTMLGGEEGMTPAEKKGIHGVIGEDVYFDAPYLKANLKVFSEKLADLIDTGKKELSIGYRCLYDMTPGVYNGERYDGKQTEIRGNHLALVDEGRSGHDVAVLDKMIFTFDSKEIKMKEKEEMKKGDMSKPMDAEEMSISEMRDMMRKMCERMDRMAESEDEFEDDMEANEMNMSENDVIDEDVEPKDFVKKAKAVDVEEPDNKKAKKEEEEENSEKASNEGDAKDEDMSKPDGDTGRKEGAMDMKLVLKEISQRDDLARKLSGHIGTFDHKDKTLAEVAKYGVKKLNLHCKPGHEQSILSGYLSGARTNRAVSHAQDSVPKSSSIDAYINGGN